jgi:hypothetical protein
VLQFFKKTIIQAYKIDDKYFFVCYDFYSYIWDVTMRWKPSKNNIYIISEYDECVKFWSDAEQHPILAKFLIHHANEGKRTKFAGSRLKKIGLRPGVPDYQLPLPNEKYRGLWIEMKRSDQRNRAKPANQISWVERLNEKGHYACFAYTAKEALGICINYLENKL